MTIRTGVIPLAVVVTALALPAIAQPAASCTALGTARDAVHRHLHGPRPLHRHPSPAALSVCSWRAGELHGGRTEDLGPADPRRLVSRHGRTEGTARRSRPAPRGSGQPTQQCRLASG